MKKFFFLIFLLQFPVLAQGKISDNPFGLGFGYVGTWIVPDRTSFEKELASFGTPDVGKAGLYASGGQGFVYTGILRNLRAGFISLGGRTSDRANVGAYTHEAELDYGFLGLTVEWGLPFIRDVAISIGATIGYGTTELHLYRNDGSYDWNGLWEEIGSEEPGSAVHRVLKNSYMVISPTLTADIPLHRLVSLRLGAGYSFAVGSRTWEADNGNEIQNAPTGGVGNAFYFQAGLFIGFFAL